MTQYKKGYTFLHWEGVQPQFKVYGDITLLEVYEVTLRSVVFDPEAEKDPTVTDYEYKDGKWKSKN